MVLVCFGLLVEGVCSSITLSKGGLDGGKNHEGKRREEEKETIVEVRTVDACKYRYEASAMACCQNEGRKCDRAASVITLMSRDLTRVYYPLATLPNLVSVTNSGSKRIFLPALS